MIIDYFLEQCYRFWPRAYYKFWILVWKITLHRSNAPLILLGLGAAAPPAISGVFRGIGPRPLWQKKFVHHIGILGKHGLAPSCVSTNGPRKFGSFYEILNTPPVAKWFLLNTYLFCVPPVSEGTCRRCRIISFQAGLILVATLATPTPSWWTK